MQHMCKKKVQSSWVCRNELSNPRGLTVSGNSTQPRLQTTVRQLELESSTRHTKGWLKLKIYSCRQFGFVETRPYVFCYHRTIYEW